jgi:hypothetical protein
MLSSNQHVSDLVFRQMSGLNQDKWWDDGTTIRAYRPNVQSNLKAQINNPEGCHFIDHPEYLPTILRM